MIESTINRKYHYKKKIKITGNIDNVSPVQSKTNTMIGGQKSTDRKMSGVAKGYYSSQDESVDWYLRWRTKLGKLLYLKIKHTVPTGRETGKG